MDRRIDRRRFLASTGATGLLAGIGAGGLLAACGGGDGGASGDLVAARYSAPFVAVADGRPQRTVWGIADPTLGPLRLEEVPIRVVATVSKDGDQIGPRNDIVVRAEGLVFPYYPVVASFERPDIYEITLSWSEGRVESLFQVFDPAEVSLLQPGEPVPAVTTPTFDDARGVDPICTRVGEPCPYHDVTLAAALEDGLPTVLLVGTPGYCQTAVCGPMLELLTAEVERNPGAFTPVHAEVYDDPEALPDALPTEVMDRLGMTEAGYEPAFFLVDADGVLAERLDNVVDGSELREAVDRLLA